MLNLWIKANFAKRALMGKLREQRGAIEMTTIVIILGIVVAVALVFRKEISTLVTNLFQNVNETTKPISGGV